MENFGNIAQLTILFSIMLFGLVSLLIPVLPGLVIIWVAVLVFAIIQGMTWTTGVLFAIITLLMLVGNLADNVLMGASARKTGASWLSIGVALLAGIVGSIVAPPLGGLVLGLAGIFLVEFARLRDWRKAYQSTKSLAAGCGWGVVARFFIGGVMITLWIAWVVIIYGWPATG